MKQPITFKWADERQPQPIERPLAAAMIRGNRSSRRAVVYFNRQERRTVIIHGDTVGIIERSAS